MLIALTSGVADATEYEGLTEPYQQVEVAAAEVSKATSVPFGRFPVPPDNASVEEPRIRRRVGVEAGHRAVPELERVGHAAGDGAALVVRVVRFERGARGGHNDRVDQVAAEGARGGQVARRD